MDLRNRSYQKTSTPLRNQQTFGQGALRKNESVEYQNNNRVNQTPTRSFIASSSNKIEQKMTHTDDEDALDVDDIDLQNKSDEDMESSDSVHEEQKVFSNLQKRQEPSESVSPKGRGSNYESPTSVQSKNGPSRLQRRSSERRERIQAANRKSNSGNKEKPLVRQSTTDEVDTPIRLSFTSSTDLEVKQAILQIDESEKIIEVIAKFQHNFYESQKKINICDKDTIEQDLQGKALKMQYKIIEDCFQNQNVKFDEKGMGEKIKQTIRQVTASNDEYNKFKGELLAINEPIINKDMLNFKLDKVQRYSEKQINLLEKLPGHEQNIKKNSESLVKCREQYNQFEKEIFDQKMDETKSIVQDTNQVMKAIQDQLPTMMENIEMCKNDLDQLAPNNQEQRLEQHTVYMQMIEIEKSVETASKIVDNQLKEQDEFQMKHEHCKSVFSKYQQKKYLSAKEVAACISQSRELKQFMENLIEWYELYERLKLIKEEQIDKISNEILINLDRAEKFVISLSNNMSLHFENLMKDIQILYKKVIIDINQEDQRLNIFELNVNKAKDDGVSKISDENLMFINIEVLRYRSSINTAKSTIDMILDDSNTYYSDTKQNHQITNKDLSILKQNYKSLQRQDTVDVPRIKRNIDQMEAYSIKATKNNLNEAQKKSQMIISKMKKQSDNLQKAIENLNCNIDNKKCYLDNLDSYFRNKDLERDNEITYKIEEKLTECDQDINADDDSLCVTHKLIISAINKIVNRFNENNKLIKESNRSPKTENEMNELISKNIDIQNECTQVNKSVDQAFVEVEDVQQRLEQIVDDSLKEKYDAKGKTVEECEKLYVLDSQKSQSLDVLLNEQIKKVTETIKKLEAFKPINNTASNVQTNQQLLLNITENLKRLGQHLEDLYEIQGTNFTLEDIDDISEPLNEMGKREVKHQQLLEVKEELIKIQQDFIKNEKLLYDKKIKITDDLQKKADKIIFEERNRKHQDAKNKLSYLSKSTDQLESDKNYCVIKLQELNHTLDEITQIGKNDPILDNKIRQTASDNDILEKKLGVIDEQIKVMRKKRADCQGYISLIESKPEKFTFQQIDETIQVLDSQNDIVDKEMATVGDVKVTLDSQCVEFSITHKQLLEEKEREFDATNTKLILLNKNIDNLEAEKSYCDIKLSEVQQIVSNINSMGKNDPQLQQKLDRSKQEFSKIEQDLNRIEVQIKDHKQKRNDCKEFIDQYEKAPAKYTMVQIQQTSQIIDKSNADSERLHIDLVRIKEYLDAQCFEYKTLLLSLGDEKGAKIIEINSKMELLDSKIEDLQEKRNSCFQKLRECQDLIAQLKGMGSNDGQLQAQIKKHEIELNEIEKELTKIDSQIVTLKKRRVESKQFVSEVNNNSSRFTLLEIDAQLTSIKDQISTVDTLREQLNKIEIRLDTKINDLKDLIGTLDNEKAKLINLLDKNHNTLSGKIVQLERKRAICKSKYEDVSKMISHGQQMGTSDHEYRGKLVQYEHDLKSISQELNSIDVTISNLKKSESQNKKFVQDVKKNPENYSFEKIKSQNHDVEQQIETADQTLQKLELIEIKLDAKLQEIKDLNQQIEAQKNKRVAECDKKINMVVRSIDEIENKKRTCDSKLVELKSLINIAQQNKDDQMLQNEISQINSDAMTITHELQSHDKDIKKLKQQKSQSQQTLTSMKTKSDQFTENQIQDLSKQIDSENKDASVIKTNLDNLEPRIDGHLQMLNKYKDESDIRSNLLKSIRQGQIFNNQELAKFNLEPSLKKIEQMLSTCAEMDKDKGPDKTADYWEERKKIDQFEVDLPQLKNQVLSVKGQNRELKQKSDQIEQDIQQSHQDIATLEKIQVDQTDLQHMIDDNLNEANDLENKVIAQRTEMGECWIQTNISMRSSELKTFSDKLDRVTSEFKDLKKSDEEYEGEATSEKEIKRIRNQIEPKIKQSEQELFELTENQGKLENYSHNDFVKFDNQNIIIEVRSHKKDIQKSLQKLKDIEKLNEDLNQALLNQDVNNAQSILSKKTAKLRERLVTCQEDFSLIGEVGEEMEDNTSNKDEDEFIEELKQGKPEIDGNINDQFKSLDKIDLDIKMIGQTKNIDEINRVKLEIDEATQKVEKSEFFIQNLENEMIEWGPSTKLGKRDRELFYIKDQIKDYPEKVDEEIVMMEDKLQEKQKKLLKEKEHKVELESQIQGIKHYMEEITELKEDAQILLEDRHQLFNQFNSEIPSVIKQDRVSRFIKEEYEGEDHELDVNSDKPKDIYYQLQVNCKHKKPIAELLKDLQDLMQKIAEFEEKYKILIQKLNNWVPPKMYKAIKGDEVDALFAYHINKSQINLNVKRISAGKYLFGTKQILAKIVNGKLLIRVGGGYCGIDEFIEQYGPMEVLKIMQQEHKGGKHSGNQKPKDGTCSGVKNIKDMKDAMRASLLSNVKTYQETNGGQKDKVNAKGMHIDDIQMQSNVKAVGALSPVVHKGNNRQSTVARASFNLKTEASNKGLKNGQNTSTNQSLKTLTPR